MSTTLKIYDGKGGKKTIHSPDLPAWIACGWSTSDKVSVVTPVEETTVVAEETELELPYTEEEMQAMDWTELRDIAALFGITKPKNESWDSQIYRILVPEHYTALAEYKAGKL